MHGETGRAMTALKYSRAHSDAHPRDEESRILGADYLGPPSHVPAGLRECRVNDGQGLLADGNPISN